MTIDTVKTSMLKRAASYNVGKFTSRIVPALLGAAAGYKILDDPVKYNKEAPLIGAALGGFTGGAVAGDIGAYIGAKGAKKESESMYDDTPVDKNSLADYLIPGSAEKHSIQQQQKDLMAIPAKGRTREENIAEAAELPETANDAASETLARTSLLILIGALMGGARAGRGYRVGGAMIGGTTGYTFSKTLDALKKLIS